MPLRQAVSASNQRTVVGKAATHPRAGERECVHQGAALPRCKGLSSSRCGAQAEGAATTNVEMADEEPPEEPTSGNGSFMFSDRSTYCECACTQSWGAAHGHTLLILHGLNRNSLHFGSRACANRSWRLAGE